MADDSIRFVLASGSPRRRELLAMLDVDFRVDTSLCVEETVPPGMPAEEVPAHLSRIKAASYLDTLASDEVLITADTVVILDGDVIGKPADADAARATLRRLSGRTHTVVTGVTITLPDGRSHTFSESTAVEFAPITPHEIDYYVTRYSPLDKAGAYGIQEWIGAAAVKGMTGSFYNVMGLPVNRLYRELKALLQRDFIHE